VSGEGLVVVESLVEEVGNKHFVHTPSSGASWGSIGTKDAHEYGLEPSPIPHFPHSCSWPHVQLLSAHDDTALHCPTIHRCTALPQACRCFEHVKRVADGPRSLGGGVFCVSVCSAVLQPSLRCALVLFRYNFVQIPRVPPALLWRDLQVEWSYFLLEQFQCSAPHRCLCGGRRKEKEGKPRRARGGRVVPDLIELENVFHDEITKFLAAFPARDVGETEWRR
jgi:hypothetical protein